MKVDADATNYALGLLGAAEDDGARERLKDQLSSLADEVGDHAALASALANPAVPRDVRTSLARAVADKAGADPLIGSLLALVALNGHFRKLRAIAVSYRRVLAEAKGMSQVEVRFAREAGADEVREVAQALSRATGRKIDVTPVVDPELLGGFVARVGDVVFDGSVARQLARLRTTLAG